MTGMDVIKMVIIVLMLLKLVIISVEIFFMQINKIAQVHVMSKL